MKKILRVGLVVTAALSALILIMSGLNPRLSVAAAHPTLSPADDPVPFFTRYITIEVAAGAPYADALWSRWQQATLEIPAEPGTVQTITLPSDSQDITASISFGQVVTESNLIIFTYSGTATTYYAYSTAQKVLRLGNEYRIDQYTYTNRAFRLISHLSFPSPYGYVGSITFTPQFVISPQFGISGTVQWDYLVPWIPPSRNAFAASTWLADSRLSQPELAIEQADLSIDSDLNPPIAHLTTTVRNSAIDMLSNPAFLQFYSRLSPSAPPASPIDHSGGWCGSSAAPDCPASTTFTNPVPALAPGQSVTLTATYPLTDAGLRDFYLQIDTFGGPLGLNAESDETNNVYSLTRAVAIYYMTGINITGPITGEANTPYSFSAQIVPTATGSLPLTYTWSPPPEAGQGTAFVTYTWQTGDPQTITVTARSPKNILVTGTHTISIEVPLTGAIITGPITVSQNRPHAYRASAQPLTATLPLNYVWEPAPAEGQATAVATYTLTDLGVHILKVSVGNPIGPVVTATQVVVSVPPLTAVTIDGPANGDPAATYFFTATVAPIDVVQPVDYYWSPTPDSGQGTAQAAYQWFTGALQTITVTARNDSGPVTGTHTILIEVPLTGAIITGPGTVSQNSPHAYSVSVQPVTATLPIDYVWDPEPDEGQATAVATYTFADPGEYTLNVLVSNPIGPVLSITHSVTTVPPLTAVAIDGPTTGRLSAALAFTATIDPVDAANPIDYQWSPAPASGQGTQRATYQWTAPGTHVISVTAQNDSGLVDTQHLIDITGAYLYLPLIRK